MIAHSLAHSLTHTRGNAQKPRAASLLAHGGAEERDAGRSFGFPGLPSCASWQPNAHAGAEAFMVRAARRPRK